MTYLRSRAWVFAAVWAVGSPAAYASSASNGSVTLIATDMSTTQGYAFGTDGVRTTKPACATDSLWMIVTPATDKAKAMYAAILTAAASGQLVYVSGTGTCDASSTRESVAYITVTP